ncbi:hypothetical protein ACROYT_G018426 [Oculina patagonica]
MGVLPRVTAERIKSAATTDVFMVQVVSIGPVRLILVVQAGRVVVIRNVFTAQVVSVSLVRLIPILHLARRVVVDVNAFPFQVVSAVTVRLIPITPLCNRPSGIFIFTGFSEKSHWVGQFHTGSTCVGQYCSSDSDCSSGESCCNGECKYSSDCFGYSCSSNSDCGSWESCCNGKCQYSSDDCIDSTAAVIAGAVIGSLVFICAISMCIFFVHRRQRTIRYGRVIEGQRVTATTVTTAGANVQSNPPHPGQVIPPSYSYPYYPPLQFEHQQHTINPPPYNPGTMAASEQPPPYTEVPQGGSGGVDAPKTSFPSAAPVLQQHWES